MNIQDMSPKELAAFVSTHLEKNDIKVVLSGGSCVSFYTENRYQSYDFDFIPLNLFLKRKDLIQVLKEIGFTEKNRYFQHPDTKYLLEFPQGPLTVGDEAVKEIITEVLSTGSLHIISPTDCIKDRLSGYYHWHDKQCLEQAVLVAQDNPIDINEIERWSTQEGMQEKFKQIVHKFIK